MKKHFDKYASEQCESCDKCYKCVKACPVGAIKIKDNLVYESENLCIDCGNCFNICDKGVHSVNFNPSTLDNYLKNYKVIALLDSTFFMDRTNYKINQLEEALILAGFHAVATGFEGLAIHDYLIDETFDESNEFKFNSNCQPFTNFVKKFAPSLVPKLLPYRTATEISGILNKERYGSDCKIVLITNCIGDFGYTNEDEFINLSILQSELFEFLDYKNVDILSIPASSYKRKELQMIHFSSISQHTVSGMFNCKNIINYATKTDIAAYTPLRFFLCSGSCFNSTAFLGETTPFEREQNYSVFLEENFEFEKPNVDIMDAYGDINRFKVVHECNEVKVNMFSQQAIDAILDGIGVNKDMPEYNCNSCGYGSCKKFAIAILNNRANDKQCSAYLNRLNEEQSAEMERMIAELNEAFSLTIPDNRLDTKLKTTPLYVGVYDNSTDHLEITRVIEEGLFTHIINCLKLAADLKDCNVFDLIGIDKNILVQSILYHCNAKTQPILSVGDVVKYSDNFENKKEEADRSAVFAKKYYHVSDEVYNIIKYHKHDESEIPSDFPKYLIYVFRLFKIIDSTSSVITKSPSKVTIDFEFIEYMLYINKFKNGIKSQYCIDLYKSHDFKSLEAFLKE